MVGTGAKVTVPDGSYETIALDPKSRLYDVAVGGGLTDTLTQSGFTLDDAKAAQKFALDYIEGTPRLHSPRNQGGGVQGVDRRQWEHLLLQHAGPSTGVARDAAKLDLDIRTWILDLYLEPTLTWFSEHAKHRVEVLDHALVSLADAASSTDS